MEKFNASEHLIQLKGKDYLQVMWRIVWMRNDHPNWQVMTDLLFHTDDQAIFHCSINDENGNIIAQGTGSETKKDFLDFIEKAETKAIGRALAYAGYGTQFTADELDEVDRLADSPVDRNKATESPKTNVQPKVVQNTTKTENIEKDKLQSLVDKVKDAPNVKIVENPVCKNCGKPIMPAKTLSAQEVANKTKIKYGKCLCVECAIKEKEAIEFQQKLK